MAQRAISAAVVFHMVGCAPPPGAEHPQPVASLPAPVDASGRDAPVPVETKPLLTGNEPTLAQIRASEALGGLYPSIDRVAGDIGPPFARGRGPRSEWWFDRRPFTKPDEMTCDAVHIIRTPSGKAALRISSFQSKREVCETIALTKAEVVALIGKLAGTTAAADADLRELVKLVRGKSFDEAMKLFGENAGKPTATGESEYATWRYVDHGECRVLLLTTTLDHHGPGSGYVETIEGLPCE